MSFPDTFTAFGQVYVPRGEPVVFQPQQIFRLKHDVELTGEPWRYGLPAVHRLVPDHKVTLTPPLQQLWKDMNPHLTNAKWAKLLGNHLAFTNGSGFPGHADWINMVETHKPLPYFDQARICGGAVVTGHVMDDYLYIETIDTRKPLPSVEYIMARRWLYFDATLSGSTIRPFPQGDGRPVYVPLLSATDGVKLPMFKLQRWESSDLPDPYRIYL